MKREHIPPCSMRPANQQILNENIIRKRVTPDRCINKLSLASYKKMAQHYKVGFILGMQSWFTFRNNQCNLPCSLSKRIYRIISDTEKYLVKFNTNPGNLKLSVELGIDRNAFNPIKGIFRNPTCSITLTEILKSFLLGSKTRYGVQY